MNIKLAFFIGKGDYLDKLVRLWTKSKYSHVELVVGDYWYSSNPNHGCVVKQHKSNFNLENWEFIEVQIEDNIFKNIFNNFLLKQLGKKYDYLGIFLSHIISLNIHHQHKWFCSELVSEFLLKCGFFPEITDSNNFSPEHLYRLIKGTYP
jgi:hypothetical protein